MIYKDGQAWLDASHKRVLLFGMSGLGKTYLSTMLRGGGDWFHYSIDYRIGTRYMDEYIADNAKAHAMKVPFLRELLMSDSIYIGSNITFDNLAPVSTYLGKPGNPACGGLSYAEYTRRQDQFRRGEIAALQDTPYFIDRAQALYGYPNFVCDTGGSICEWVEPTDPNDPILSMLAQNTLMIWIKGDEAHTSELIRRFDKAPKPMSYQPQFLDRMWRQFLKQHELTESQVDPDTFIRWIYGQALAHRQPLYARMADWGITVSADEVAAITQPRDFEQLVARVLDRQ